MIDNYSDLSSDDEYTDPEELQSLKYQNNYDTIQKELDEKYKYDNDFFFLKFLGASDFVSAVNNYKYKPIRKIYLSNYTLDWYYYIISLILGKPDPRFSTVDIQSLHNTLKCNKYYVWGNQKNGFRPTFY